MKKWILYISLLLLPLSCAWADVLSSRAKVLFQRGAAKVEFGHVKKVLGQTKRLTKSGAARNSMKAEARTQGDDGDSNSDQMSQSLIQKRVLSPVPTQQTLHYRPSFNKHR